MKTFPLLVLGALLALPGLVLPSLALAQPIDLSSGGAVEVTASGGFEWHESEQAITATGDARAVRGDVTVLADELIAHYRHKAQATPTATDQAATGQTAAGQASDIDSAGGGNEVYRLQARGHVRIVTATDEAVGDQAVYDIDQAVLVMTGHALKLTTPQYVLTARDSLEYWSQKHMAVGRGQAVVLSADARRLAGDVLVGYTSAGEAKPAAKSPASAAPSAKPGANPLAESAGKLERLEAYGNVEVRTGVDTVRGDRGVYLPDTGQARLVGNVHIFHDRSVVNGSAADVNMKTGIGHVVADPSGRVQGMIQPNDATAGAGAPAPATVGGGKR